MSTMADPHEMLYPSRGPLGPALPAPEPVSGGGAGITPADVWRIVKQRKLMIFISFVILYALVIGATVATYVFFPLYPSTALVELRPQRENPYDPDKTFSPETLRTQIETEARKLKQLSLLQEVIKQPEIQQTQFYQWYGGDIQKCLYDLEELVQSAPIPETMLIRVSLATKSADESQKLVSTIVNRYTLRFRTTQQDRERANVESLKGTLGKIRDDLRNKQAEIAAFRQTSDIPTLETERGTTIELIGNLNTRLAEVTTALADQNAQLGVVQNLRERDVPITAEMKLIIQNDPILRFYQQQVEALDVELQALKNVLGDEHRQARTLRERQDGYRRQETLKREELIDDLRRRYVETLQQEVARLRSVQAELQEQLGESEAKQRDLDRDIERYRILERDEQGLRRLEEDLDEKVRAAEHAFESLRDPKNMRADVVQAAERAVKPSRPDFVLYLGGGFVLALLGAFGLAFLRELSDTSVRTPIDVVRHGQLSVLGAVPMLDYDESDVEAVEQVVRVAPQSLVAETFRQIRTTLQYSGPAQSQRSILITSPSPGDGKTAIAINLAVTLARSNQRVLLIDCNFRRPGVRAAFPGARAEGLSNLLIGEARLEHLATRSDLPNLDVLTSGRMPPTPAELLGSPLMRDLLQEALQRYDRVILDGPPALLISDALVIASQVDAVILVTRAVANSKGALRRSREQLERVGARVVGAILNGVQPRPGGYYSRQYREFYDYTTDETVPSYELPAADAPAAEPPPADEPPPDKDRPA
ncbi:MAG: polysaccharide biosynthesis tyrosine autokinase [Phycisphaerae bacterium]